MDNLLLVIMSIIMGSMLIYCWGIRLFATEGLLKSLLHPFSIESDSILVMPHVETIRFP